MPSKKLKRDQEIPSIDWQRLGINVRSIRTLSLWTQKELANLASVSLQTIHRIEAGTPVRIQSLFKVTDALNVGFNQLISTEGFQNLKTDCDIVKYSPTNTLWMPHAEDHIFRGRINEYQNDQERSRLGSLGWATAFVSGLHFIMKDGPGILFMELYNPFSGPFNPRVYKDCIIYCLRGDALFTIGEQVLSMSAGSAVGFETKEPFLLKPIEQIEESFLPPLFMWVGANRIGKIQAHDIKKQVRIRKTRK